jgi:hypothetical protein
MLLHGIIFSLSACISMQFALRTPVTRVSGQMPSVRSLQTCKLPIRLLDIALAALWAASPWSRQCAGVLPPVIHRLASVDRGAPPCDDWS